MKWMRFRVRTKTDAEDILISFMEDIGLYGAQIEDNVPLTASEKEDQKETKKDKKEKKKHFWKK